MIDLIKSFSDLTPIQQPVAGGKGGTLARLYQTGLPVPDGFVALPEAFDNDELKPEAWNQVQAQLELLRRKYAGTAFAVRSSALAEDSARASFAGEFQTVLDARGDHEIRAAICNVRRSRRSERVQSYSRAKGANTDHEVAVIVQILVPAEISGVLFTADPITGSRETMTGNFVSGLGDKLVSGEATGKAFTIERPGGQYQGPAELRRYARKLFRLAARVENELGHPQDIEWAIWKRHLYLLQSRPITTLIGHNLVTGEWNDSLTGDYLWSNVNFGEAVTEVMTPLSWTVLKRIFGEWVVLPGYDTVGNIGGRPYLNISVFASLLHATGKNRQELLETLEGTLYMKLPEDMEIPMIPLSKWRLFTILPTVFRTRYQEWKGYRDLPSYLAENQAWCRRTQRCIQDASARGELARLWEKEISPHVTGSLWNVMGSVSASTGYSMPLRRELGDLVGRDDADVLLSNLSDRSRLLASLGPVVGIARLARGEMEREAYLEQYGHRGEHEFELSVPRPSEDPYWVDAQLARFNKSPVDVDTLLAKQRAEFEAAWARFRARYPRKVKKIRRRIDQAGHRARLRELARSEYVRDRGVIRAFALRAAELTGLGDDVFFLTLDELLDVLNGDESAIPVIPTRQDLYTRFKTLPPYPSIISGRFDPFLWASDPKRRTDIFDSHVHHEAAVVENRRATIIEGSPGSAGQIEGPVRRLEKPEEGDQLQEGEVLVTAYTDIAWTLLFPRAAAIVTDVGAPLSHAAIVARELGVPAVVGCGDATMRLRTGDRVRVDGGQGIVEILGRVPERAM